MNCCDSAEYITTVCTMCGCEKACVFSPSVRLTSLALSERRRRTFSGSVWRLIQMFLPLTFSCTVSVPWCAEGLTCSCVTLTRCPLISLINRTRRRGCVLFFFLFWHHSFRNWTGNPTRVTLSNIPKPSCLAQTTFRDDVPSHSRAVLWRMSCSVLPARDWLRRCTGVPVKAEH